MELLYFSDKKISSPAFVIDEQCIRNNLRIISELRTESGCKVLYSMKALPLQAVLQLAKSCVDGISVSSLFEARLAKEIMADQGSIHLTTPGIRADEFTELSQLCSHISFNSLGQMYRMTSVAEGYSSGLRLNPKLSFLTDPRFDPCRLHSKLGVDIHLFKQQPLPEKIEGLHIHTVFSCQDFSPLLKTVEKIKTVLFNHSRTIKWLNFGGGYLFAQIENRKPFIELVRKLKQQFELDVYIEPGKAIVGQAGYLVSTVVDRFISDHKNIVVLDTSVNHNPEVFEYQRPPQLLPQQEGGYSVILAGSTCLAGDIFGEYNLRQLPEIGDRLVFKDLGAYSLIKANRFNGYNFPDIYSMDEQRQLTRLKHYDYQDYRQQWITGK